MARLTGEECGRTNSDVNADKNSLMKQFALGVKVGRTKKSIFDYNWSKRIGSKLFGVCACIFIVTCCSSPNLLTSFIFGAREARPHDPRYPRAIHADTGRFKWSDDSPGGWLLCPSLYPAPAGLWRGTFQFVSGFGGRSWNDR